MEMKREMTKKEKSLLLYLESRGVDYSGRVDVSRMNQEDVEVARRWDREGFVQFGRIKLSDCWSNKAECYCHLSPEAYALAAEERRERAERNWTQRGYALATGTAAGKGGMV